MTGLRARSRFALAAPLLACTACDYRKGALDPASSEALLIHLLWWVFFWVSVFVLSGVLVALALALYRGRARGVAAGSAPEVEPDAELERRTGRAVLAASALSILILLGLLVASVLFGRELFRAPHAPLSVKIVAHQWWWEVEYPGKTSSEHVRTANEVHLPAGVPVELELRSVDVIHSLWIPNLHGKRDLIPGHTNHLVLRPQRPGRYEGRCAEFCGLQHARMELAVVIEPPEVFSHWLERQRRPAPPPGAPDARRGADVFVRGSCSLCHGVTGSEAAASNGPDLTHVASRARLAAGALPNSPLDLRAWISDPQSIKPGAQMPPTALPSAELDDLVAYLETLR